VKMTRKAHIHHENKKKRKHENVQLDITNHKGTKK